jgi:hypothetical protein
MGAQYNTLCEHLSVFDHMCTLSVSIGPTALSSSFGPDSSCKFLIYILQACHVKFHVDRWIEDVVTHLWDRSHVLMSCQYVDF